MKSARNVRILLFSVAILILLFNGVSADDSRASPLHDVEIALSISASPSSYAAVGEVISYTFIVHNRSGYEMYDVLVEDDRVAVSCPGSSIEGSQPEGGCEARTSPIEGQMTCTGTYVITQADIDNGQVATSTSASGTFDIPGGCSGPSNVTDVSTSADFVIEAVQEPSISLTKTASPTTFDGIGDVIAYTYTVVNTGNVSLPGPITITDDTLSVSCPTGGLAPTDAMQCTASYTTTETDVVNGSVFNSALASAGAGVTAGDSFEVLLEANPELALEKYASTATYTEVWELIVYTFNVFNSGNVAIEGPFTVVDVMLDEWDCPATTALGPGESLTCMGYYRVREPLGDPITNCAVVEGLYLGNPVASNQICVQIIYAPPDPFGAGG